MKKLLNLLMVFLFVSAMVACGGNAETEPAPDEDKTEVKDSTANDAADATETNDSTANDADADADADAGDADADTKEEDGGH